MCAYVFLCICESACVCVCTSINDAPVFFPCSHWHFSTQKTMATCFKKFSDVLNCHISYSFSWRTTVNISVLSVNMISLSLVLYLLHSLWYLFLDSHSQLLSMVKLNKCNRDRAIRSSIQAPLTLSGAAALTGCSLCFTGETPSGHSPPLYLHLKSERNCEASYSSITFIMTWYNCCNLGITE